MKKLDPNELFEKIYGDVPNSLHRHLFVTGSLAAAYQFCARLEGRAVNTKDADLVVHPAGDVMSCQQMTKQLLESGWSRTTQCHPQDNPEPTETLRAIRLFPPESKDYFIEFLNLPASDQGKSKQWIPIRLDDGWYGLPSFRFLSVTSIDRLVSHVGLEYASPAMMALSNLLSHPRIGIERIESGQMKGKLRSAKDLGRVVALAYLEGRNGTEAWLPLWSKALRECFPQDWKTLQASIGSGLMELLSDSNALQEAQTTTDIGLLGGMNVSVETLNATGQRLLVDVIKPLERFEG